MKLQLYVCAIVCLVLSVGCAKRSTVTRLNDELAQKNAEINRLEGELTTQQRMNEELQSKLSDLTEENRVLIETNGSVSLEGIDPRATAIMDIKCPGSGMSEHTNWKNLNCLCTDDELKFREEVRAFCDKE